MNSPKITEAQVAPFIPPSSELAQYTNESGPVSLVYRIGEHQSLSFHGVNHTKNPEDVHFAELRRHWGTFVEETEGDPESRLAVIEGAPHHASEFPGDAEAADSQAIRDFGEGALTCLWAEREGVEVLRPELSTKADAKKLLGKYIPEEVVTFYAIREVTQLIPKWKDGMPTPPYEEYVSRYLAKLHEQTEGLDRLEGYDFSYDYFRQTHEYFLGTLASQEQAMTYMNTLTAYTDPAKAAMPITRTCEASNYNRDLFTGSTFVGQLAAGRAIYGAYGWYHVRKLQPLLNTAAQRLTAGKTVLPG